MFRNSTVILLLVCVSLAYAAKTQLPAQYKKWLNEEVVYIITDEERKSFLALQTDEQREKFIQDFWDIRNPLRGSDRNPYKDEIYRRIEYANAHFGRMTNTPGWMTDMGRAWILLGKPVSAHPFVGFGQIYPLELWSYANETGNPSLPPFFNLLFFQPEDIEEYRFYRPYADGPLKLVRGSNFNTNADVYRGLMPLGGDVAHAAFSLIPNDPIDRQTFHPEMSSDMLIAKIQNLANDSFNLKKLREMRMLREHVSSYFLAADEHPVRIDPLVLSDPTGQYWLDYAVAIDRAEMGVRAQNGADMNMRIEYKLMTAAGVLIVEDSEERAYPAFDTGADKAFLPFEVANRLPIVPGEYKLEVTVVNGAAGKSYKGTVPVSIKPQGGLQMRGPLLSGEAARAERPDGFTPFEYYGVQFHPSAQRIFVTRAPITVLYELEQGQKDPAAGCVVEYVLASVQDRAARRMFTDTVAASDFHEGRLLKSKTIPLAGFDPGEYQLVVTVREIAGGPAIASSNMQLKLVNDRPAPVLYISANSRGLGRGGVASYIRALEASAQQDEKAAAGYMQRALEQNPANSFAGEFLVRVYFRQRNYGGVADLYHKLGISPFKTSSQALAEISLSCWQTGQKAEARKIMAEARSAFPDDSTLKNAAQALRDR